MTTREMIITACFSFVMALNVTALVRHWRMMRVMHMMLSSFAETQNQFNEIMQAENDKRKASLAPE